MPLPVNMAAVLSALGHFGWIPPARRTQAQQDAHTRAVAVLPRLSDVNPDLVKTVADIPKGTKVMLTDFWKAPEVVVDLGKPFTGFGQKTGSCVGVSEGNAVTTALCIQRTLATGTTKAEVCFWPFPYGRTRYNEGDRGQGEGAVDSVMGDTLVKEGYFAITESGLPGFTWDDNGLWIEGGSQTELQWSDGARIDQKWKDLAAKRSGMHKVIINSSEEEAAAIFNGYPVLTGCSDYVGHGSVVGSGDLAYVKGRYDGRGGHSTCRVGIWNHPNDGLLIAYSNQWDTSTYPKDPAGLGRCCTWMPLSEEDKMLRQLGGGDGETMLLSAVPGVPAQPAVADWAAAF
jgi:hypothetical protein